MAIKFKWPLDSTPGINKDQTNYSTSLCIDGEWVRFYENKAKKIGGYRVLEPGDNSIARNVFAVNLEQTNEVDIYVGRGNSLKVFRATSDGNASIARNRTPSGFAADNNNKWTFSLVTYNESLTEVTYILACAVPSLENINSSVTRPIYYGRIDNDNALTPLLEDDLTTPIVTAGGMTVIGSIIVVYDKNGQLFWNSGSAVIANGTFTEVWPEQNSLLFGSENFIYGDAIRNGNTLGGLFWAIKGLVKLTLIGTEPLAPSNEEQPVFEPSYASPSCTLYSSTGVVYYDPYYYWPGKDTHYIYTGVVDEIPNTTNRLYFFENLLPINRNKIFGFPNFTYGEIWWGWANGNVRENNDALILNKNVRSWFNTANFNRSCGINDNTIFPYPILCSSNLVRTPNNTYPIWVHEFGTDIIINQQTFALPAYIQFKYVDNPNSYNLVIDDLILDIKQTGNLILQVSKQGYPRSTPILSDPYTITPGLEHLSMREKGNLLSLIFSSNEVGGDFLFGNCEAILTGDESERPGPVNE